MLAITIYSNNRFVGVIPSISNASANRDAKPFASIIFQHCSTKLSRNRDSIVNAAITHDQDTESQLATSCNNASNSGRFILRRNDHESIAVLHFSLPFAKSESASQNLSKCFPNKNACPSHPNHKMEAA